MLSPSRGFPSAAHVALPLPPHASSMQLPHALFLRETSAEIFVCQWRQNSLVYTAVRDTLYKWYRELVRIKSEYSKLLAKLHTTYRTNLSAHERFDRFVGFIHRTLSPTRTINATFAFNNLASINLSWLTCLVYPESNFCDKPQFLNGSNLANFMG